MLRPNRLKTHRPERRLPILLAICILLPGVVLSVFAWRALNQERAAAARESREQVEAVAENAARRAELDFAAWRTALEQVADLRGPARKQLPAAMRGGVPAWTSG